MAVRVSIAVLGLLAVLVVANYSIWQKQNIVDNGQAILLQLRPVDPRSLMQGDYMVLRYAEQVFPEESLRSSLPDQGTMILSLDEKRIATFNRIDEGGSLNPEEARLNYKQINKNGEIRLGAESFFFQEGRASEFDEARYGVLHVDADGNSVLVGLADERGELIQRSDKISE